MTLNNRNHIYRPVEVTSDGESCGLNAKSSYLARGEKRIGVEACGVCHGDGVDVTNLDIHRVLTTPE